MKITIVRDGTYADFESVPGKCGAVTRQQGDKVDYPAWYAESLIVSGHAREAVEVITVTEPEVIPFSEPVISPSVEWDGPVTTVDQAEEIVAAYAPYTAVEWQEEPGVTEPTAYAIPDATDKALLLATAHGIKLGDVEGTGKDGRITVADVRKAIPED